jgi:hypothetical protein
MSDIGALTLGVFAHCATFDGKPVALRQTATRLALGRTPVDHAALGDGRHGLGTCRRSTASNPTVRTLLRYADALDMDLDIDIRPKGEKSLF